LKNSLNYSGFVRRIALLTAKCVGRQVSVARSTPGDQEKS